MHSKFQYRFTPLALTDIEETLSYITQDLANPLAAKNLYMQIEKAIEQICIFPYAHADCSHYMIVDKNIRHIKIGNYLLFYEIKEQIKTLHILRFRYAKMNFEEMNIKDKS